MYVGTRVAEIKRPSQGMSWGGKFPVRMVDLRRDVGAWQGCTCPLRTHLWAVCVRSGEQTASHMPYFWSANLRQGVWGHDHFTAEPTPTAIMGWGTLLILLGGAQGQSQPAPSCLRPATHRAGDTYSRAAASTSDSAAPILPRAELQLYPGTTLDPPQAARRNRRLDVRSVGGVQGPLSAFIGRPRLTLWRAGCLAQAQLLLSAAGAQFYACVVTRRPSWGGGGVAWVCSAARGPVPLRLSGRGKLFSIWLLGVTFNISFIEKEKKNSTVVEGERWVCFQDSWRQ